MGRNPIVDSHKRRNIQMTVSALTKNEIFPKLQEIAKREGRYVGEVIEELMADYVNAHSNGNPQIKISDYLQTAGFMATPMLFRDKKTILDYAKTIENTTMKQLVHDQVNMWVDCLDEAEK